LLDDAASSGEATWYMGQVTVKKARRFLVESRDVVQGVGVEFGGGAVKFGILKKRCRREVW
jgi:hypothetical protein